MFLSGLELFGFKSFPKRTKLTFEPGVMSIVGPNGCGKSNIVDAVRWVLGEQRTSILRSEKMENVIFAGADGRKPMNLAEITLTIENTEGVLPAEYSEVAVTRRLYRNGDSEYLINKRPVRLKDIRNLFADTGLGPDSYSIIELSMVEGILSGKPEERRKLFEEAAGVTLYKARLRAAQNKFTATDADLVRLDDLLGEVESQRRSLLRQVKRAKRYRYLIEAHRVKELSAARDEVADLRARMLPLQERIEKDRNSKATLEKALQKSEEELAKVRGKLGSLEERVTSVRQEKDDSEGRLQLTEREIAKLEERLRSGRIRNEEREREEAELTSRRKEIATDIEQLHKRKIGAERRNEEIRVRLGGMNEAWSDFETRRVELYSRRDSLESQLREAERRAMGLEGESVRIADRNKNLARRLDQLRNEAKKQGETPDTSKLAEKVQSCRDELQNLEKRENKARSQFDAASVKTSSALNEHAKVTGELEAARRRVALLEGMVQSGEGRSKAIKALMGAGIEGLAGRLGDAVVVEEKWRPAVTAALEDTASAIVMIKRSSLKEAAELLLSGDKGRGTLIVSEEDFQPDKSMPPFEGAEGVISPLLEQVKVKGAAGKAAARLLERVWLMENLDSLLTHAKEAIQAGWTLVTPDGCRLTPDGLLTAGTIDPTDLGATQLLEEAKKEKARAEKNHSTLEADIRKLQAAEAEAKDRLDLLVATKREATALLDETNLQLARSEAELEAYQALNSRRETEIKQNEEEIESLSQRAEELRGEVESARAAVEERSDEMADLQAGLHGLEEEGGALRTAREKLRDEQVEASSAQERLSGEVRRQGSLLEELGIRQQQLEKEDEEAVGTREDANERLRLIKAEAAVVQRDVSEQLILLDKVEKEYNSTRNIYAEKTSALDTQRTESTQVTSRLHAAEMEVSDLKHRFSTVRETIIENYQIDLLTASQVELPLTVDEENPYLDKTLSELREGLQEIGPVNQMALEEFEVVDRRFKSMSEQREDLVAAKETLQETIDEINDVARRKFLETFGRVEGHFIRLFAKLFGGGVAELSLADGDPLEAGIRIYATPKGKRLTSIDLLSGGEKAMTAIALLFSLYLERPAPFCFLDEVDAPLDDVNVIRFNNLLREFTNRTQFIVVTHNKLTMEHADRLYGVTMEEEGISHMVAVQIPGHSLQGPVEESKS